MGGDSSYPYESHHVSTMALCGLGSRRCVDVCPQWSKPVTRRAWELKRTRMCRGRRARWACILPGGHTPAAKAEMGAWGGRGEMDAGRAGHGTAAVTRSGCGAAKAVRWQGGGGTGRRSSGRGLPEMDADTVWARSMGVSMRGGCGLGAGRRHGQTAQQRGGGGTGGACQRGRDAGAGDAAP